MVPRGSHVLPLGLASRKRNQLKAKLAGGRTLYLAELRLNLDMINGANVINIEVCSFNCKLRSTSDSVRLGLIRCRIERNQE